MFALLTRSYGVKQTPGLLTVYDEDTGVFQCKSLELPYLENHKNISCIPPGEYDVERIHHRKHGICFWVKDVPGRDGILFHSGNFAAERILLEKALELHVRKVDTLGCILVGLKFADLNDDGNIDVSDSQMAMDILRILLPSKFKLIIR